MKNTADKNFATPRCTSLSCTCPEPYVMRYLEIDSYNATLPVYCMEATWNEMACTLSIELTTKAGDKFSVVRRLEGRVEIEDLPGIVSDVTNALLAAAGYAPCKYYEFFQCKWDIEEYRTKSPNLHINPDMV